MSHAYAQGYGLALAQDFNVRRTLFGPTLKERMAEMETKKEDETDKKPVKPKPTKDQTTSMKTFRVSTEEGGTYTIRAKDLQAAQRETREDMAGRGRFTVYEVAPGKDQITDPPGGANATAHGAKHEVARAEIAGKTGVTGGPPTNKGSKVKPGKLPLIEPKMSWPSSDSAEDYKVYKLDNGKFQVWWNLRVSLGTFATEAEAQARIKRHQQTLAGRKHIPGIGRASDGAQEDYENAKRDLDAALAALKRAPEARKKPEVVQKAERLVTQAKTSKTRAAFEIAAEFIQQMFWYGWVL